MPSVSKDPILDLLDKPLQNRTNIPILVKVLSGDTVSQLITKYYDTSLGTKTYKLAMAQFKRHNPNIRDISHIRTGQVLKLMPIPAESEIIRVDIPASFDPWALPNHSQRFEELACGPNDRYDDSLLTIQLPDTPEELEVFHRVSWFEQYWFDALSGGTSAGLTGLSALTGSHNTRLIHEVGTLYTSMKAGKITRNQYNYQRQKSLKSLAKALGATEKFFFKGKTAQEAVRISRVKGIPATDHVLRHAKRLGELSKIAGNGGSIVLAGASLANACYQIGQTSDKHEQNEIFVESVVGTAVGYLSGSIALVMVANPIGITVALAIGVGSAIVGYGGGKIGGQLYDSFGKKIDFVGMSGMRGLCG